MVIKMKRNLIKVITINEGQKVNTNSMTNVDRKQYFESNCLLNDNDTITTYCKQYFKALKFIEDNKDLEKWCTMRFNLNSNCWGKKQSNKELLEAKNTLCENIINDIQFEDEDKEYDFYSENHIGEENDYDTYQNNWILSDIENMINDFFYGLKSGNLALNA